MMSIGRVLGCSLVVVLVAAACSDDEKPSGGGGRGGSGGSNAGTGGKSGSGGGGSSGTGGSGGSMGGTAGKGADAGDAGPPSLSGTTVEAVRGELTREPVLAGVEACVVDANGTKNAAIPCSTTNAAGEWSLPNLTPNQDLVVLFSKAGFAQTVIAVDLAAANITGRVVRMGHLLNDGGADGGTVQNFGWDPAVTLDTTKGTLNAAAVQASASPDAGSYLPGLDWTTGVSFTITPAGGNGPYYVNPDETWASSATSTVNAWGAWFLNLTPGMYTVKATHPTLSCNASGGAFGWAQTDGTSKAPVIAGIHTQSIAFFCTARPADAGTD
jgi:hypothetical protein